MSLGATTKLATLNSNITFENALNAQSHNLTIGGGVGTGTVTVTDAATNMGSGTGASLTLQTGQTGLVRFKSSYSGTDGLTAADGTKLQFDGDAALSGGDTDNSILGNLVLSGMTLTAARALNIGNSASSDQVTLSGGAVTITTAAANKPVTLTAKVDGAEGLTVNAGTALTSFNGAIGSSTPLASLTTDSGGSTKIGSPSIATTGDQNYNDPLTLAADTSIRSSAGKLVFGQTVDGNQGLTVQAGSTIDFKGAVGTTPLTALTIVQSTGATFEAAVTVTSGSSSGIVTLSDTTGLIDFHGVLTANSLVTADQSYGIRLRSGGNVASAVSFLDTGTLTIDSGFTFAGGVSESGASSPSLNTLAGFIYSSAASMSWGKIALGGTLLIDSTNAGAKPSGADVDCLAAVDGAYDLTLRAGTSGLVTFTKAVGATTALGSGTALALTIPSASSVLFDSTLRTINGISITPPVSFYNAVDLDSGTPMATTAFDTIFYSAVNFAQAAAQTLKTGHNAEFKSALTWTTPDLTLEGTGGLNPSLTFDGKLDGAGKLTIDANTYTTGAAGTGPVIFMANLGSSTKLGSSQVVAAKLQFADNVAFVSNDADITFETDDLVLGGTAPAVSADSIDAGAGTVRILPLAPADSIEFAPVAVLTLAGTTDVFIDSRFAAVKGASFILGGIAQTGDIYLGNPSNAVTANYDLVVTQSQSASGTGKITFENNYIAGGIGYSLTLNSGKNGVVFGDQTASITVTLGASGGAGAFTNNVGATAGDGAARLARTTSITAPGGIVFSGAIDAATSGSQGLTLESDTGAINIADKIGSKTRLGALKVTNAAEAAFAASVTAASFEQDASSGAATTTFGGAQDYTGSFAFTGQNLTVDATWNIVGTTTVTNAGTFTLASGATTTAAGGFKQNGAGTSLSRG